MIDRHSDSYGNPYSDASKKVTVSLDQPGSGGDVEKLRLTVLPDSGSAQPTVSGNDDCGARVAPPVDSGACDRAKAKRARAAAALDRARAKQRRAKRHLKQVKKARKHAARAKLRRARRARKAAAGLLRKARAEVSAVCPAAHRGLGSIGRNATQRIAGENGRRAFVVTPVP